MMAPEKLLNIRPTINTIDVSLSFFIAIKINPRTTKLPIQEAKTMLKLDANKPLTDAGKNEDPSKIKATPRLDPELSPNTYGPASGFLNKVCMSNPLMDKPIPTRTAVIAFGILKFRMM